MNIKKVIFPIAGLGTRFLPVTKSSPKEMLPIIDKPLIHYAVEEAIEAGATELIFVTRSNKRAIEDYFDEDKILEQKLREQSRWELLKKIENIIPKNVHCIFVRQPEPLGLGHAILCASHLINKNELFGVILADDFITHSTKQCFAQLVEAALKYQKSVIAIQNVALEEVTKYGIITGTEETDQLMHLTSIIEKPTLEKAPSQMAVVGRYVLTSKIFPILKKIHPAHHEELQLTEAIEILLKNESVYGLLFAGVRYDCGTQIGYLKAILDYALTQNNYHDELISFLKTLSAR